MPDLISLFQQNSHWPLVQQVVLTLNKVGEKAFLAGGCVRDALLGHVPKDFDIATSTRPEKMIKLFSQSRQQGKAFGVVVVFDSQGHEVEVATFRKDGPYRDGRHPEYVEFLSDKEDALRRDFTINGLFYDINQNSINTHKIIDYVGGLTDIQKKIIRCVGDPETRFQEDHLRILRALRFSLKLNFSIEKKTEQSLLKMKTKLLDISKERVYEESLKILQTGKFAEALSVFNRLGLLKEWTGFFKENTDWPACQHFWHSTASSYSQNVKHENSNKINTASIKKDKAFLWAIAFFPLFISTLEDKAFFYRLKKWKFPVTVIKGLKDILRLSHCLLNHQPSSLGKKLRILDSSLSTEVLFLCKTYLKSQNQDLNQTGVGQAGSAPRTLPFEKGGTYEVFSSYNQVVKHENSNTISINDIKELQREFKIRAPEGKLPKALVNGHDLKALGFQEDKTMAPRLERLYDLQLEQNIKDKKALLKKSGLQ